MEAARVCAVKGHNVTVFEKSYDIGGQINIASVPPRKGEMTRAVLYYRNVLPALGVTVITGRQPSVSQLNDFDEVIVAVARAIRI